ncbi:MULTISPECIES: ShlB/FhaC/HecB family hemolysin secretion/activation protein [unclassified Pseudomonas]|uniref:ShlB/FhaC/HecB family hemolysin secretion/activation protein n=1 Tax=unclassified Pseudomonas TaxID=196821 RepID=UPI000CD22DF5|nr:MULTISPECIES: ShlB/FhaC/HecB family hemolysin secretion/activation protein [unclassified Pseudomonas]POA23141.1 ShlB family hemolysin secretion/activation protein [Pseudomonas sp. FW305-3-2-15-E-TSA4]POA38558.1 ShlB family hemolysin secretion/activation protein [Pseudomonas sp. FW305-3-2-15-E-TSA2]
MPYSLRAVFRRRSTLCPLLSAFVLSVCASSIQAADPVAPGQEVLRQQQQQQRDLQQLQMEQRKRQLERGAFGPAPATPAIPQTVTPDERCWPLSGTRIGGVTLIDSNKLNARIKPLLAPCMGVGQINHLLATITAIYVEQGYIASRPYLLSAPAAGQSLDIMIDEGYIESIELADQSLPVSLGGAFPHMLGQPLNLRDLEQGLDQLNRLRSIDLTADIAPGSQPGASRIILRSRTSGQSRWALGLGMDNLGSASTGRDRNTVSLSFDSPLQLNDLLSLSASDTLNQGDRYSRNASLYYAIPYGYWTYSVFASHAEYRAPFKLPGTTLYSTGITDQLSLRADRVLWRDQSRQLSANLQLAHKDVDSYLENVRLGIQSPTLTVAEAGLNLFWLDRAVWNLDFSYSQGLRWLGADDDANHAVNNLPKAQFRKYRAGLSQWRNGQFGAQAWQWQSQLNLQYSPDPLPAIEQLLGTDDSAVRGYRVSSASGASGAIWRNTLRLPLRSDWPVQITPRVGLDNGWLKADHGAQGQRLSGASVGLNLGWKNLQVDVDYQRALNTPKGLQHEPETWLMRVGLQI